MSPLRRAVRRGFTLIELLLVITIILLISGLFLGLSTGDGGGLPAGQRLIASSIRTARAMALMNLGPTAGGVTHAGRYRVLILNDPNDEANHLRQFVIAVGGVSAAELGNLDPNAIVNTSSAPYRWFSPEPPQLLPQGVVFVPPASETSTTMALNVAAGTRRSSVGQLADNTATSGKDAPAASPPWMMYAPTIQPMALGEIGSDMNPKKWFYVELQGGVGTSNHLGRVLLVLARANVRNTGTGTAAIDVASDSQFAAIALRPNGDVTLTLDADEMDKAK